MGWERILACAWRCASLTSRLITVSTACGSEVFAALATSFTSQPLCRTSRQWRCVYSALQQVECAPRLPERHGNPSVVFATRLRRLARNKTKNALPTIKASRNRVFSTASALFGHDAAMGSTADMASFGMGVPRKAVRDCSAVGMGCGSLFSSNRILARQTVFWLAVAVDAAGRHTPCSPSFACDLIDFDSKTRQVSLTRNSKT
jgi:hypothetical protein